MIVQTYLRSLIRQLGLRTIILPLVELVENRRLNKLGTYSVRREAQTLIYTGFGRTIEMGNLTDTLCELGLSHHERTTITAVLARLPIGSIAWDIGANVGFYSKLMSLATGDAGKVFAFEPNAVAYAQLTSTVADRSNVKLCHHALGNVDGSALMTASREYESVSRIVQENDSKSVEVTSVPIFRGDTVAATTSLPRFIKIDVEGHELDVLRGMRSVISSSSCATVLVEVHFETLQRMGCADAPREIVQFLRSCGLSQQTWIGRSHLLSERP